MSTTTASNLTGSMWSNAEAIAVRPAPERLVARAAAMSSSAPFTPRRARSMAAFDRASSAARSERTRDRRPASSVAYPSVASSLSKSRRRSPENPGRCPPSSTSATRTTINLLMDCLREELSSGSGSPRSERDTSGCPRHGLLLALGARRGVVPCRANRLIPDPGDLRLEPREVRTDPAAAAAPALVLEHGQGCRNELRLDERPKVIVLVELLVLLCDRADPIKLALRRSQPFGIRRLRLQVGDQCVAGVLGDGFCDGRCVRGRHVDVASRRHRPRVVDLQGLQPRADVVRARASLGLGDDLNRLGPAEARRSRR